MCGLYSRAACNQERLMMARVRYIIIFFECVDLWPKIIKSNSRSERKNIILLRIWSKIINAPSEKISTRCECVND